MKKQNGRQTLQEHFLKTFEVQPTDKQKEKFKEAQPAANASQHQKRPAAYGSHSLSQTASGGWEHQTQPAAYGSHSLTQTTADGWKHQAQLAAYGSHSLTHTAADGWEHHLCANHMTSTVRTKTRAKEGKEEVGRRGVVETQPKPGGDSSDLVNTDTFTFNDP